MCHEIFFCRNFAKQPNLSISEPQKSVETPSTISPTRIKIPVLTADSLTTWLNQTIMQLIEGFQFTFILFRSFYLQSLISSNHLSLGTPRPVIQNDRQIIVKVTKAETSFNFPIQACLFSVVRHFSKNDKFVSISSRKSES